MKNIKYEKSEMASYLNSPLFNNNTRSLLLSLRSRTERGIRNDFRGMYPDTLSPFDFDTLQNVLTCSVLKHYHTSKEVTDRNVEYNDIYSNNRK